MWRWAAAGTAVSVGRGFARNTCEAARGELRAAAQAETMLAEKTRLAADLAACEIILTAWIPAVAPSHTPTVRYVPPP